MPVLSLHHLIFLYIDPQPHLAFLGGSRGKRLPGPANPWPFGYIVKIKEHRDHSRWYLELRKLTEHYGPVMGFRVFTTHVAIVTDPELARLVVTGSADVFPKATM